MAWVPKGNWTVTFSFVDNNGKRGSTSLDYPNNLLLAEVVVSAREIADAMQAVSDASLTYIFFSFTLAQDAPVDAATSSEVERKLFLPLGTALNPSLGSVQVPSPVFALEQPGTDIVAPTAPGMAALIDAILSGAAGTGNGPVTASGLDITRVGTPVVVHRSRRPRR